MSIQLLKCFCPRWRQLFGRHSATNDGGEEEVRTKMNETLNWTVDSIGSLIVVCRRRRLCCCWLHSFSLFIFYSLLVSFNAGRIMVFVLMMRIIDFAPTFFVVVHTLTHSLTVSWYHFNCARSHSFSWKIVFSKFNHLLAIHDLKSENWLLQSKVRSKTLKILPILANHYSLLSSRAHEINEQKSFCCLHYRILHYFILTLVTRFIIKQDAFSILNNSSFTSILPL